MNGNRSFSASGTRVGPEFKFSRLILALAPVFVTFLVQLMIWPIIWPFAWFLFSPALFLSAWIGGWRLGIVASVIATLLVWVFFLPLERSAVVEQPAAGIVSATVFMGMGIVFSLFHDRLKRAQRAVAEALATSRYQAQLESVFQAIQDGIVVTDMKGAFILLNEAEARINGFPSAEAMKQNLAFYRQLYELSYPDGTPLPFEEWPINKVLKGESISNFELRARRRDTGQEWLFSLSGEPVHDEKGEQILAVLGTRDVTEQKRAEESLRASENRFRSVFENAAVGIARAALDGRFVEVNQRLCDMIGYAREELLTKTFMDITHPDYLAADLKAFRRMLAGEIEVYVREKRYCRKDGSAVWASLAASLVHKAGGSPDYFVAVIEDISTRKQAEEKLREGEERLRLASRAAGLGIFEWDVPADRAVWENERMYEIFGHTHADGALSRAELVEKYLYQDDVATLDQALAYGMKSGSPFRTIYRIRRKDGALRWLGLAGNFELAHDRAPIRMIGVLADITEQHQAEERLRTSEEQFRILADTAPVMIWISGTDKLCTFFNKPWLDFTGRSMEQELGDGWTEGVHRDDYDRCLEIYVRSFEAQEPFQMEYRLRRCDGEYRWIVDNGVPRFAPNGDFLGYIGSCIDIHERKEIEEALRASELRFRTMVSAIPSLTYEGDSDGNNTFVSDQWLAYTGMTVEETVGRGFIRTFHPDDAAENKARYEAAVRSGTLFESRLRIRSADGSYRWFLNRALPGYDAAGRIVRWAGSLTDIDGLIRAEERQRENELRFRTMISAVPSLIFEADADGNNIFVSDQWLTYTGMTAEDTVGSGFIRAYHPDEAEDVLARWGDAVRSGMPFESKCRIRAVDGSYRWFLNRAQPGRDAEGRIVRWAGSLTDIEDLIRIEQELRESESRFRQLAESLPQLVWTCRADGKCDYINPQFVAYTGIPEADQLGFGWLQQIHPDDRESLIAAWDRTVATGSAFDVEYRIRRNDGVYRWFKTRALALKNSGGRIIKWLGTNTDIDDQIKSEQALRESKERLAAIVSTAMDAIITVDEDQRVVLFNEAAERMFRCPAAEAIGQTLDRFIPECFRRAHSESIRRLGRTGGTSRAMARLNSLIGLRTDGSEFPIEAAISKIEVGGRKLYTVIHRDITERKRAEVEHEKLAQEQLARAAAEAANRSKDEFLAMVSHELRSPLTAILGYTRMLRSGPADRDAINKVTAIVERSAKAQLQIIEDLLDSARIIAGKLRIELEPIDLVPVLEAALDTAHPAAEAKGVKLIANFDPAPEQTLGDSTRLQQVVWNLLTNAVKFTPDGGRVELRMEGTTYQIRITVSDNGKGIEPEFLPFVFDRFRQADSSSARRVGGLGLGLSLVKHLVELHGGTIAVASEGVGRGSTFTVMLPRRQLDFIAQPTSVVADREVRTEGALALDEALSLEGVSVLVVDDQEETRVILTQALREYRAHVIALSSGVEALALLTRPPGGRRPDVLILDIAMPGEDGYTVLKKVRVLETKLGIEASQIPAIALTAFGRSEDRLRALQAGFQMHVAKPVEPAELALIIASLTNRRLWEGGRKN